MMNPSKLSTIKYTEMWGKSDLNGLYDRFLTTEQIFERLEERGLLQSYRLHRWMWGHCSVGTYTSSRCNEPTYCYIEYPLFDTRGVIADRGETYRLCENHLHRFYVTEILLSKILPRSVE